jgi:hypothetical protein
MLVLLASASVVRISPNLIALFLLQCNTSQKDNKELRNKNELLEQELKQAKEKTATVTKVK